MKSNNFQQPQNFINNSINKNPYRIQNYNYMFYLIQDNPQLYNLQNYYLQLYQLGLLQNNQQAQLLNLQNGQNVQNLQNTLPLYYSMAYNRLLQLSLLNSNNNNLTQNQNLLPTMNNSNNFNEYQNSFSNAQNIQNLQDYQNNILLNKKRLNIENNESKNEIQNESKKNETNDINENLKENNNSSLNQNEIKNDGNDGNNSEIKNIQKKDGEDNIEEKNDISTTKKEDKNEISTTKEEEKNDEDEKDTKTEPKKKKKKKMNYKDLLYDSLLERIGKEEKKNAKKDIELEEEEMLSSNTHTKKKEKNKKSSKVNTPKTKQKQKNKNGKHSKKKQHKITLKNNKDILADLEENKINEDNSKYTKIIFHGDDYKKTKNINEFMKYNFDFVVDEQYETKKLITDYDHQHVDENIINGNTNIYDNYNYTEQHLDEINNVWSREKFIGDNNELKKAINVIRDSFNERKIYTNEEKYLDIIKSNNYNINEFINKKN